MKHSLPLCALLLSSFILSGCNEAQIASFARQNDIILTPEQVQSIANANQQNGNALGKNKGNDIPVVRIGNGNNGVSVPLDTATQILKGEQGAQGAQGERGEKGEQGERGADGAQGEKGEKGDKGDKGDQGEQGEKGETGRGIESLEINDEGHLIAHYTDGETQDVGLIRNDAQSVVKDFEKEGYVLDTSSVDLVGKMKETVWDVDTIQFDYDCSNLCVKLQEVNENNPRQKYHYVVSGNVKISNYTYEHGNPPYNPDNIDEEKKVTLDIYTDAFSLSTSYISNGEFEFVNKDFYTSIPAVRITEIRLLDC